jgi:hypothetical protein
MDVFNLENGNSNDASASQIQDGRRRGEGVGGITTVKMEKNVVAEPGVQTVVGVPCVTAVD